jgi:hypothetical protein
LKIRTGHEGDGAVKQDLILAGVGGQGILTIAQVISQAAVKRGLHVRQAEVHGMAQRGGGVQSHLRISDREIYSDIPGLVAAARKPLIVVVDSGALFEPLVRALRLAGVPVFPSADQAIRSLGRYLCHRADRAAVRRPVTAAASAP